MRLATWSGIGAASILQRFFAKPPAALQKNIEGSVCMRIRLKMSKSISYFLKNYKFNSVFLHNLAFALVLIIIPVTMRFSFSLTTPMLSWKMKYEIPALTICRE
jgi:hypothetical protein